MVRASGESKSRLVKAAGAGSCGQRRSQKLHAVVARSTFSSQNVKRLTFSEHFLKFSSDVKRFHVVVARSTFSSQNVQNMSASDHFLKFRCRKIARHCVDKHILKSKC